MEGDIMSMPQSQSQYDDKEDNEDDEDFGLKFKLTTFPANHFGPNFDEDVLLSKDDFPSHNLMAKNTKKLYHFFYFFYN